MPPSPMDREPMMPAASTEDTEAVTTPTIDEQSAMFIEYSMFTLMNTQTRIQLIEEAVASAVDWLHRQGEDLPMQAEEKLYRGAIEHGSPLARYLTSEDIDREENDERLDLILYVLLRRWLKEKGVG